MRTARGILRGVFRVGGGLVVTAVIALSALSCRVGSEFVHAIPLPGSGLPPCPPSPNCLCSQDPDPDHRVDPLTFTGSPEEAFARLKQVVRSMPRAKIADERPNYFRAEYTTALMRVVDDVDFLIEPNGGKIHIRSASRVGYSDLGANRKRIERIRRAFDAAQAAGGPASAEAGKPKP